MTVIEDDKFTSFEPASDGIDFYESLERDVVQAEQRGGGSARMLDRRDGRTG